MAAIDVVVEEEERWEREDEALESTVAKYVDRWERAAILARFSLVHHSWLSRWMSRGHSPMLANVEESWNFSIQGYVFGK
jgi:hypothetical protein